MNDGCGEIQAELRRWTVAAPLPAGFKQGVWRKIAVAETAAPWRVFAGWLDAVLARPLPAAALVGLLVMLGMGAGVWKGSADARQRQDLLVTRYVQSIDPYQGRQP